MRKRPANVLAIQPLPLRPENNSSGPTSVQALVPKLPEVYQPIYGHPELSVGAARSCEDRMTHIANVYRSLANHHGRALRVLDLGCSQGYFSIGLAVLGADVHGVDVVGENIAVCAALAAEHSELRLSFSQDRVEGLLARLTPGQYDLVLGLSVFHHMIHEHGVAAVTQLLGGVAHVVETAIYELALRTEPLYWAAAQPEDPRELLVEYAFIRELDRVPTHLSQQNRPLYVASNRMAILGEVAYPFTSWQDQPHALAQGIYAGTRRYFFGPGSVIKLFSLEGSLAQHNLRELSAEVDVLSGHREALGFLPELLGHEFGARQAWLARAKIPGALLLDLMREGTPYDDRGVVTDVLSQLAALEGQGLYHSDVRAWNVVVSPDGSASLIDFGAITGRPLDCVWPQDIFIAFFIFLHEVAQHKVERVLPMRQPFFSPHNLPQPYKSLALRLWRLPMSDWSFARLHKAWLELKSGEQHDEDQRDALGLWMGAAERHLDQTGAEHQQMVVNVSGLRAELAAAHSVSEDLQVRQRALRSYVEEHERVQHAEISTMMAGLGAVRTEMAQAFGGVASRLEASFTAQGSIAENSAARDNALLEQVRLLGQESLALLHAKTQQQEALLLQLASLNAERVELKNLVSQHQARHERSLGALHTLLARSQQEVAEVEQERTELAQRLSLQSRFIAAGGPVLRDLLSHRGRSFVKHAYYVLFGRLPDPQGLDYYAAQLAAGTSRVAILDQLRKSAEGRGLGVNIRGLTVSVWLGRFARWPVVGQPVRALEALRHPEAVTLDWGYADPPEAKEIIALPSHRVLSALLATKDARAVEAAYWTILRRAPDSAGFLYYDGLIRAGHHRVAILGQIYRSPEGRQVGAIVPGLRTSYALLRLLPKPLISKLRRPPTSIKL